MATLTLDPDNAALSMQARLVTIEQCKKYIRETVARYDGLNALDVKLAELGITDTVAAIVAEPAP